MTVINKIMLFAFIFLSFNRELSVGLDLRPIIGLYFVVFVIAAFLKYPRFSVALPIEKNSVYIFLVLIGLAFASQFSWIFNGLSLNSTVYLNSIFLLILNFAFVAFISLNFRHFGIDFIVRSVFISGIVLFFSVVLQAFDLPVPLIESARPKIYSDLSPFGFRVAGYAEDPNYTSLLSLLWFYFGFRNFRSSLSRLLIFLCFLLFFGLSFSKTIFLSFFFIPFLYYFPQLVFFGTMLLLLIAYVFILFSSFWASFDIISTLSIRFAMWEQGLLLFSKNPVLGSGLTSVRSNFLETGHWYVQPHSTVVALLSDFGLFFVLGYFILFYRLVFHSILFRHFIFALFFLSLTNDISLLQIFPVGTVLVFYCEQKIKQSQSSLRLVV